MAHRIVVAAGGTGGHLYPALSLAEAIWGMEAQVEVTLVTSSTAHNAALLHGYGPLARLHVESLPIQARASQAPAAWLRFGGQLWRSWHRARRVIAAARPQVVVGFGSYVSAPVIVAARLGGCRTLLHEQNVLPGHANRWLAPLADGVAVSCAATQQHWRGRAPRVLTGNPVRSTIGTIGRQAARAALGLAGDRPTLLVLGGSRGARAINRLMLDVIAAWSPAQRAACQLVHLAGAEDAATVAAAYAQAGVVHRVMPFCNRMAEAYASADLVVARAGATTLAELAAAGCPAALIPYPHGDGHQRANARWWVDAGAGVLFEERALSADSVAAWLGGALQDARRLQTMAESASSLACPDAARGLAREVFRLAGWTPAVAAAEPAPAPVMVG